MKNVVFLLVVLHFLVTCKPANTPDTSSIKHEVYFDHPASKTGKKESNIVYELTEFSQQSDATRYYMDVSSVYCGEDVCKVDTVRLFWDELGRYTKLMLKPNVKLEKGDAEDFEPEDYLKLDQILSNRHSDLANLHKDELVTSISGGNAADALTGATVAIRKTDYIKGAIWTCYTLWHFVNGEIVNIVRNISGKRKSIEELRVLLASENESLQLFALQQLIVKKDITRRTLNIIVNKLEQGKSAFFKDAISYLNILSDQDFQTAVTQFSKIDNRKLRSLTLENLIDSQRSIDIDFYINFAKNLGDWQEYQDVKQFLNVLEHNNISDNSINGALIELLDHNNFVVARGVYWYLRQQQSTTVSTETLNDFFQKHQNRL